MAAWCFIKSDGYIKLEKDGNNIETIQVNGTLDCPIAPLCQYNSASLHHYANTTAHPVCDNMLVYCINAPSCSGHDDGISYTIGEMQRNPYYIHINETVVPPESVPCPKCTACPTLTQSMDCPAPTVCPSLMQSMDCPTTVCPPLTPTPTIYQTPTTACPTPPEFPSPTKYPNENSTCPFNMTGNLSRPTIQKLTPLHVGVVLVTLILISLN